MAFDGIGEGGTRFLGAEGSWDSATVSSFLLTAAASPVYRAMMGWRG